MSDDVEPAALTVERARDTEWFRARTQPAGRHGGGEVVTTSYGKPWAYLIGVAALPVAFILIGLDPFGGPRWVYGALIYLSALPGWNMVQSWAEDRRISAWSGRAANAQLWLYVGGAVPEALRVIRQSRAR